MSRFAAEELYAPENPRAVIGDNAPSPFEQSREEIETLYGEARHWLDGSGVQSQADADGVSKLLDMLRKAVATADERRKAEVKPFDDGKAEVQARYNPLIADSKTVKGKAILAIEMCKQALAPYLLKLDAEKKAAAEAARQEAERAEIAAQAAFANSGIADLERREEAERLAVAAKAAQAAASKAEKDKAQARGGTKAVSLRTYYIPEIEDARAFAAFLWSNRRQELLAAIAPIAKKMVDAGARDIPGVKIIEDRRAV